MKIGVWLGLGLMLASCRFDLPDAPVDVLPRCAGLPPTCGANEDANCCETGTIPGGMFHRIYDKGQYNDMSYPAMVSAFVLDKYEVTVGRFRAFVNAGMGTQANPPEAGAGAHPHPTLAGSGWDSSWNANLVPNTEELTLQVKCILYQTWTWTDTPGANENKPMNCVNWYEAMAFCIWDGGYLPTEAEWNYAASGGNQQRTYPWSDPASTNISCDYANYTDTSLCGGAPNRVGSETPKGDGMWGHSDLAGNVYEWMLDWNGPLPIPCNDCANLMPSDSRVVRGGSFANTGEHVKVARRSYYAPSLPPRGDHIGLRCARTP